MKEFKNSILTGKPLTPLFSLGEIYISDFIEPGTEPRAPKCELALAMDEESGLVQLTKVPDASYMWGDSYWYKSGTNAFMKEALLDVVKKTYDWLPKEERGTWLDIASNDGTLLGFVSPQEFPNRIGIDPSSYPEAKKAASKIVKDYFSADAYWSATDKQANVVTCCAMFYDLENPVSFLKDVNEVLSNNGLFVLQLSYTPLMLRQQELGNVCHEHIAYYTLKSLEYALDKAGFQLLDVELNNVNGGSLRAYCIKKGFSFEWKFKTQADRDVAAMRIESLRAFELVNKYNEPETYIEFYNKMLKLRFDFLAFLRNAKNEGSSVWGYGASTKGNTMLQWLGLGPKDITKIAERQTRKVGLVCAGSNIPVCSEEEARNARPDFMIVFPWHFISEFVQREKGYLQNGGNFIVLSPKLQIINA